MKKEENILFYKKILFPVDLSEGIDLIIMGHSRKGIKRLMTGSVAAHVVKKSLVPVLIVNPHGKGGGTMK